MSIQIVNTMKSISNKKENGIVYTPAWIVALILKELHYNTKNILYKKIIDPACGDGAFLSEIVQRFINKAKKEKLKEKEIINLLENNIYGFDIDFEAAQKCKNILNEIVLQHKIGKVNWKIYNFDSLEKSNILKFKDFFDFVVGNPPYIRIQHLGKARRDNLQENWDFCRNGSMDIYIAFFELGYFLLNKQGRLGYITPNTYLKTSSGKILRQFLKFKGCLETLIDFGHHQLFDEATTYSAITILDKEHYRQVFHFYRGEDEQVFYVDEIDLNKLNIDNWVLTPNKIAKKIKEIETRGAPLEKIARIHVGITTLADGFYIFQRPKIISKIAEIKLKDGRTFKIEKDILKPIIKASVLKDSNDEQFRHIIFPYKKVNGKHVIIPEEELSKNYPFAHKYFLSIKDILLSRDKGKPNPVAWYAFGRSQGLDTSFGKKILTSPMNIKPNFIVWGKEEYTFYAGYCIKFDGDLNWLVSQLNSEDMNFYIKNVGRDYRHGYKSYAKSFIKNFGICDYQNKTKSCRQQLNLAV